MSSTKILRIVVMVCSSYSRCYVAYHIERQKVTIGFSESISGELEVWDEDVYLRFRSVVFGIGDLDGAICWL
jgi:hypothetical protein